ncbi:hypothetical protein AVEN_162118-1 [Araneus ventricosus]|uniref:Uncharacterized protein n=1 Tax=Araneus ventricosus TaxID=182803 RepID=A0A4Y2R6I0_ARAVE|nr:hypothetical protein AVEN_162118-1 [Araneus ventricosus]
MNTDLEHAKTAEGDSPCPWCGLEVRRRIVPAQHKTSPTEGAAASCLEATSPLDLNPCDFFLWSNMKVAVTEKLLPQLPTYYSPSMINRNYSKKEFRDFHRKFCTSGETCG